MVRYTTYRAVAPSHQATLAKAESYIKDRLSGRLSTR